MVNPSFPIFVTSNSPIQLVKLKKPIAIGAAVLAAAHAPVAPAMDFSENVEVVYAS